MLVTLAGCAGDSLTAVQQSAQVDQQRRLGYAGPWSEPVQGVRCRMRLADNQVRETELLLCALELWNDSSAAVELNNTAASKFARATTWAIENEMYFSESLDARNLPEKPVRLAPGTKFLIGPARLRVTPAVAPRLGAQRLSASTLLRAQRLSAPPALVSIMPAQWGPAVNGVRLCIGIDSNTVKVSDPIAVFLYIHNTTNNRLAILAPDWSRPQVRSEDDLLTLIFTARRGAIRFTQSPRAIQRREILPGSIFDRSGVYRLRVVLDAPPLSFVPSGVWTGSLVSNELTFHVQAPEKPTMPAPAASTAPSPGK
jgi:hypothetical protein